jgi:hypothetical protein
MKLSFNGGIMKDFISQYCDQYEDRINTDLFDRSFDKPLVEYVIDTCKNLEVLPAITLESYEYIEDQSRIDTLLDKRWEKDPKIKNNKSLDRLVGQNQSLYNLLILNFRVDAKGQTAHVQRKIRIPKLIKGRYYMRGGKLVLPLIQIVDNSTFVKGNTLNFKTTLYPIKLNTTRVKLPFIDDEISVPKFHIDLFKKITSPLYYYLAQYGLQGTIEMFRLENIVSVVDDILDESKYMYIRINPNLYIEVHEKGFYAHEFVGKFLGCLYEVFSEDKKITLKDAYDREYWLGRLAEVFSKKRNPDKGERVLISFKKITDPYTKNRLKLPKYHKRDTFRIVRWMMVNYTQLLQKDSNDLINKRMRVNEIQAYYFDSYIARNVYSLLNTDNPPFTKYLRLLNSINEFTLIKAATSTPKGKGAGKASITSMYRYERYNDFDAIDLTRYTLKGPTGLNGGKKKTSMQYRDIYPSHIGRYDLNVCSSSDPGLTGYLCANCQFDKNGHFSGDNNEPDEYDNKIDKILNKVAEKGYEKNRADYIALQLSRDSDGFLHLQRRIPAHEMTFEFMKNPWKYGLYWNDNALRLMHRIDNFDNKGFLHLQKKSPSQKKLEKDYERDEEGFIVLRKKENKLTRKLESKENKKKKKGKKK